MSSRLLRVSRVATPWISTLPVLLANVRSFLPYHFYWNESFADGCLDGQRKRRARAQLCQDVLGITNKLVGDQLRVSEAMINVHLHLPAGAQKEDGPRVGVAMVCGPLWGWV